MTDVLNPILDNLSYIQAFDVINNVSSILNNKIFIDLNNFLTTHSHIHGIALQISIDNIIQNNIYDFLYKKTLYVFS